VSEMLRLFAIRFGCLFGLLLLTTCHDASRENPFDPVLTPPVELSVALDDTAGTVTLSWTPYVGEQPFGEYWVLRNIVDRIKVDTLAVLEEVEQTAFVDTSLAPNTAYGYRVSVVNTAGLEVASPERRVPEFDVQAVRLLAVENRAREGVLALRWTCFRGADFQQYQVRRRISGSAEEEILAEGMEVGDTTFVDSTVRTEVDYVYTVVVQAADQTLESNSREGKQVLPAVRIEEAHFDSRTASARLGWTGYEGPRFAAYRVERRTAELARQEVQEIADREETSWVDTGLVGNTAYFYRVVVMTERGEEVASAEVSDIIHPLVASWPLAVEEDAFVRLYAEEEGRLTALVAGPDRVRLLFFGAGGQLREEQVLLVLPEGIIEPQTVATTLTPEGKRFLILTIGDLNGIIIFEADGRLIKEKRALFADVFPEPLTGEEAKVDGAIGITGNFGVYFDNVMVSTEEGVRFAEDFESGQLEAWNFSYGAFDEGWFTAARGSNSVRLRKEEPSWSDFHLGVDVLFTQLGWVHMGIGSTAFYNSRFYLDLYSRNQRARLVWYFRPPRGSELERKTGTFEEDVVLLPGVPYRLGLGFVGGRFSVSLEGPTWAWARSGDEEASWNSLALMKTEAGDGVVLGSGRQTYDLSQGEESEGFVYEDEVSEVRAWRVEGSLSSWSWLGICLPRANRVLVRKGAFSTFTQRVRWPTIAIHSFGAGMGQDSGEMLAPLSLDAGPDGRVFVLDAGNARIQVFDQEGNYITQFGGRGSGAGEFDFGSGWTAEDFVGSLCVDADGYIYVADVGNRRIQKFAP